MPKRRGIRTQDRAQRIATERRHSHTDSMSYFGPAPPHPDDDPPSF
ncbi:hypothetical protein [Mycobacterium sp.]